MSTTDIVGTFGVSILLCAFAASSAGRLDRTSLLYNGANAVGAALACWASWQIPFWPFVVLEGAWTLVALSALLRRTQKGPQGSSA